jgi:sugar phosphate isomerase/epimerase
LEDLGPPQSFQAIVHTRNSPAALREWFAHLGERITHLHVFLPPSDRRREEIGGSVSFQTLAELGFDGSLAIEFVDPMNAPGETTPVLFDKAVADLQWLGQNLAERFAEAEPS